MKIRTVLSVFAILCPLGALMGVASVALEAEGGEKIFSFQVIETREISGRIDAKEGEEIVFDWGDGERETFSGGEQEYSRDYGEPVNLTVKIYAEKEEYLTGFRMDRSRANISFDLGEMSGFLDDVRITGANTVTGNISDLPDALIRFVCAGNNTISGDVADLPRGLVHLNCAGENTIEGDLEDLPPNMSSFFVRGRNTIAGNVETLPQTIENFTLRGDNTITGNLAGLPRNMSRFFVRGGNSISGNVESLPRTIERLELRGDNTVTGDLSGLPREMIYLDVHGSNTLTGDIGGLPPRIFYCRIGGNNAITGDLAALPEPITRFVLAGDNRISDYTPGRKWAEQMCYFTLSPAEGYGLSGEEVDAILGDLAETTWTGAPRQIVIAGNNASRSRASDPAVRMLLGMGVSLTVNEEGRQITR